MLSDVPYEPLVEVGAISLLVFSSDLDVVEIGSNEASSTAGPMTFLWRCCLAAAA